MSAGHARPGSRGHGCRSIGRSQRPVLSALYRDRLQRAHSGDVGSEDLAIVERDCLKDNLALGVIVHCFGHEQTVLREPRGRDSPSVASSSFCEPAQLRRLRPLPSRASHGFQQLLDFLFFGASNFAPKVGSRLFWTLEGPEHRLSPGFLH